ncbi:MAG: copper chaperone PCu(A)C [Armatimonadota bacterium]|nr:copper chaperone PCu(A)C [Armatimonadota bacterium]MDR7443124.1 copper chaperone PCu(A)C [Armatimonadota bacterium]MDR7569605.1 copper chaperone PCu(A)C [Armatimonadota bacterium]MDR7614659.1 copper chaperone PCu(A)C [Armatimonadota bacterium]
MRTGMLLAALILALGLAQAATSAIEVEHPWARPGTRGGNSAVYMEIHNRSSQLDRLVAAEAEVAEAVELHRTRTEGGMHRMEKVESIEVPGGAKVELKPGGYHIMLIRLTRPLRVGERFPLKLRFARAGDLGIQVPVRQEEGSDHGGGHR